MADYTTKQKILNAAEHLIANQGFDGASLRAITKEAGVNLAAVHYHFQSKDNLIKEILNSRLVPLNKRRIDNLEKYINDFQNKSIPIEKIIDAFVEPVHHFLEKHEDRGLQTMQLIGRAVTETDDYISQKFNQHFEEVNELFVRELQRTLKFVSEKEIRWRLHFFNSSLMFLLINFFSRELKNQSILDPAEHEELKKCFLNFHSAGFMAKASVDVGQYGDAH